MKEHEMSQISQLVWKVSRGGQGPEEGSYASHQWIWTCPRRQWGLTGMPEEEWQDQIHTLPKS